LELHGPDGAVRDFGGIDIDVIRLDAEATVRPEALLELEVAHPLVDPGVEGLSAELLLLARWEALACSVGGGS
jgi:hypothetical protein